MNDEPESNRNDESRFSELIGSIDGPSDLSTKKLVPVSRSTYDWIQRENPSDARIEYQIGREFMDSGCYEDAIERFNASLGASVHYKTLQLIGECLLHLGRSKDAIVPLAASVGLNSHFRQKILLAEAMLQIGKPREAMGYAQAALDEAPGNRMALDASRRALEAWPEAPDCTTTSA